jgi:DNA ligase-1
MYDVIERLQATNSTNEKIEILKEYKDNFIIEKSLYYALSPKIQFYINKLPKIEKVGTRDYYDDFESLLRFYNALIDREITGNDAIKLVKEVLELHNKKSQEAISMILRKKLSCNIGDKIVNKAIPNLIPTFDVQLANTYDKNKNYKVDYWYASPKLDGLRCVGVLEGDKIVLYSRQGKPFVGLEHISQPLTEIYKQIGITFFDGELYSDELSFSEIQSIVLTSKDYDATLKQKIKYVIFAILPEQNIKSNYTAELMIKNLISMFKVCNLPECIERVEYVQLNKPLSLAIETYLSHCVERGYEGIMLRNPKKAYDFKRSDNLLKVKLFNESDFKIVDVFEGSGKYCGKLGGVKVKGVAKLKDKLVEIESEVGSGFNDAQRDEFWQVKNSLIGQLAEIKYQEITETNGQYSLRFPVFNKLKLDREFAVSQN